MFKSKRRHMSDVERAREDRAAREREHAERTRRAVADSNATENARRFSAIQFANDVQQRVAAESNLPPHDQVRTLGVMLDPRNVRSGHTTQAAGSADVVARIEQLQRARNLSTFTEAAIEFGREDPAAYDEYRRSYYGDVERANAERGGGSTNAVVLFDQKVIDACRANPSLSTADALQQIAARHPDLAKARNAALALSVGPGGVVMMTTNQ